MAAISAPIDFLGLNYYSPHYIAADADADHDSGRPVGLACTPEALERTSMGWVIEPDGLYDTLRTLAGEIAPGCRLYVTENGCAAEDYVNPEGEVIDTERVAYLEGHLDAAWRAIRDGVPLDGYFHWSLLDNFEWAWGYQKRFGLVYVDFQTQHRLPKRSAWFFEEVARANALPSPRASNGWGAGAAAP